MAENGSSHHPSEVEMASMETDNEKSNLTPAADNRDSNKRPRFGTMNSVHETRKYHTDSFTMHGLNHIFSSGGCKGIPKKMDPYWKMYWLILVLFGFFVAVYLNVELISDFFRKDVKTSIEVEWKASMVIPPVIICEFGFQEYFYSYNDCSSNSSDSWNERICSGINRKCPKFYDDQKQWRDEKITCDDRLLGQCVVWNAKGDIKQDADDSEKFDARGGMIRAKINPAHMPLRYIINPPGVSPFDPMKDRYITSTGYHRLSLSKITKDSTLMKNCIIEDSAEARKRNIFVGNYTIANCQRSCVTKLLWKKCHIMTNIDRAMLRNNESWRETPGKPFIKRKECYDRSYYRIFSNPDYESCTKNCLAPCVSTAYQVHENFLSSGMLQRVAPWIGNDTWIHFRYDDLEERVISFTWDKGKADVFSAVGGMLGLMCGMSFLSFIEIIHALILYIYEKILKKRGK